MLYPFLKIKKLILGVILFSLILSGFYFYRTNQAQALDGGGSWAQFFQYSLKEFGLDTAARLIARRMLSTYLNNMVAQINQSGRTGRTPSFVLNWRNFLTDAQYRGEDVFRSVLGNTVLCPQNEGVRTIFRAPYSNTPIQQNIRVDNLDPFTKRGQCTLPRNWSIESFNQSFSANGGWDALMKLSEPQNNYFGTLINSFNELAIQRAVEAVADSGEAQAGRGHTGTRASCNGTGSSGFCTQDPSGTLGGYTCTNNRSKNCFSNEDCAVLNSEARCRFMGEVLTPGQVLGDSASNYVDKNVGWLISSDELTEVILNLIGAIIDKMTNFRGAARNGERPPNVSRQEVSENDDFLACINTCRDLSNEQYQACMENCGENTEGVFVPDESGPTPTPTPNVNLPDSTSAVTVCNDGASAPNTTNTCLTAQWARQGGTVAQAIDPTGLCANSNCVVLNHKIAGSPTTAYIDRSSISLGGSSRVATLTGAPDYPEGTRVDTCMTDGAFNYILSVAGLQGIQVPLTVPTGGEGSCQGGSSQPPPLGNAECSDGLDNDGDGGLIDYGSDPECSSPGDTSEAF